MKKSIFILSLIVAAAILFYPQNTISLSTGSPGGKTGSPMDNADCMDCHIVGGFSSSLTHITSNIPPTGYSPGTIYTITANINPASILSGFEVTCEENTQNSKTGTFFITNSNATQLVNNSTSVTHTTAGNNMTTWSFDWEAPISGTGDITFYGSFIEAGYPLGANFTDYFSSTILNVSEYTDKTYVPDDNFENYLEANGMGDGIALNDFVFTANINTVTNLDVNSNNIADLTGIEDFISLAILNCRLNQLTSLNISNNTLLTYLKCDDNQLTNLDVSNNTNITELQCDNNQITNLDLGNNTALTNLNCATNQLASLDVSNNTALSFLSCDYNQITSLDLSYNIALDNLWCSNNQLTSLNISQNIYLDTLWANFNYLTSLDVEQNTDLFFLECNDNQLTSIDLSQNNALTYLYCYNNQLTSLDLSNNTALINLNCATNQLASLDVRNGNNTNITFFWSAGNTNLYCIDVDNPTWSTTNWLNIDSWAIFNTNCSSTYGCTDPLACNYDSLVTIDNGSCLIDYGCTDLLALNYDPIATCEDSSCIYEMTFIPDDAFEAYLEANGMGNGIANDDYVLTININTVNTLDINSLNISDLTGIEDFTDLISLSCAYNQLTSINIGNNITLEYLHCNDNQLTSLNVSGNTALTNLNCRSNQIDTLNINNNIYLTYLDCSTNNLDTLSVSNNINLIYLYCRDNQLKNIDVSSNTNLSRLYCDENQLTNLYVNNNFSLSRLECYSNQLTSLDLSNNDSITSLLCYYNQLTKLDLRNGNITNITTFSSTNNPHLYCVDVGDTAYSTANLTNIDAWTSFGSNCATEGCRDSITVTNAVIDSTNLTMDIAIYNGYNYFLNYPRIAFTIDANGDTIQTSSTSLFVADDLDTTWYTYPISNFVNLTYPLTMYFIYSNGSLATDTCTLTHNPTLTNISEANIRGKRNIIRIIDVLGRESREKKNTPLFYIYDGGTIEKRIIIE